LKPLYRDASLRAAELHRALVDGAVPSKCITRTGAVKLLKPDFWRGKLLATPGGSLRVLDQAPEFHADDGFVEEAVAAEERERELTYFYLSRSAAVRRWPRDRADVPEFKPASKATVHKEVGDVYDEADKSGTKHPNIRELEHAVRVRLGMRGLSVSRAVIEEVGGKKSEFAKRRLPPGPHFRK
jgi:hypothetical protein